jgi:hypothetical protein
MAGWAEIPSLKREGQEEFMTTVFTSDMGKSIVRNSTVKIAVIVFDLERNDGIIVVIKFRVKLNTYDLKPVIVSALV